MSKVYSIVTTGSTGFIGRRVSSLAVKNYPKQKILFLRGPKKTYMEKTGIDYLKKQNINPSIIDLTDKSTLSILPQGPKLVIHLAANTDTYDTDHRVNDEGVVNLLDFIKPDIDTHIIHISTTAFMSANRNFNKPLNEKSKTNPTNLYSRTKLEGEKHMIKMSKKLKFKLTILRLPTVYGSNMRPKSLFDELNKMVEKRSFLSRLNWPGLTDLVHVDDVAKTIILVSKSKQKPKSGSHEIYILSGESMTLQNIFKQIYLEKSLKYKEIILPNFIWKITQKVTSIVPVVERIVSPNIYNWLWRSTLIVNSVIWCDSTKIKQKLKTQWNPNKLKDYISQVV